jgi:hypothetical protein
MSTGGAPAATKEEKPLPVRFYGYIELDATRLGRDAGKIAEEVVQHLSALMNSNVEITLEIKAEVPDGVPDNVVRTITEQHFRRSSLLIFLKQLIVYHHPDKPSALPLQIMLILNLWNSGFRRFFLRWELPRGERPKT